MTNKNLLSPFGFLGKTKYEIFLDILTSYEDKVSKILYLDSQSGLVYPESYGGFFVDMFNLILRTEWLSNDQQHELIDHIMNQAGDFGSFSYFVKILSIILETNDIHIEPNLGDLRIIATGSSSTLLGNIITYEKGLKMIEWQDKYIVAQIESAIFGDAEEGGFLFYFLSNFLVLGDFATITLEAGE